MRALLVLLSSVLLAAGTTVARDKNNQTGAHRDHTATTDRHERDTDVTYGRIKEFNPGQKLVVNVDNAPDRNFDLTERDQSVKLAAGLKTGDPVKVTEREVNGKKVVQIVKHTGNVTHGDSDRAYGARDADKHEGDRDRAANVSHAGKPDVTYGRIRELNAGQKLVVDVDNAPDKSFDLTDRDETVNLAAGLNVGDPVKITEHKVNGKNVVQIVKHTSGNVRHGDKDRQSEVHDKNQ